MGSEKSMCPPIAEGNLVEWKLAVSVSFLKSLSSEQKDDVITHQRHSNYMTDTLERNEKETTSMWIMLCLSYERAFKLLLLFYQ